MMFLIVAAQRFLTRMSLVAIVYAMLSADPFPHGRANSTITAYGEDAKANSHQIDLSASAEPTVPLAVGFVRHVLVPFGWGANQTAGVFSLGRASDCVMGGAQDGQSPRGIGTYKTIDSVAICIHNSAQAPLFECSGTYDRLHFYPRIPLSSAQLSELKHGTWIQTSGSPSYRSWVTGYADDGSSVEVIGWWSPGKYGYVTPVGKPVAYFGVVTKIFGNNTVVSLDKTSFANSATAQEVDVINNQDKEASTTGLDVVQYGSEGAKTAYIARGLWDYAYLARAGQYGGFVYDPNIDAVPTAKMGGFVSRQNSGIAFAVQPSSTHTRLFSVDASTGTITVGETQLGPDGLLLHTSAKTIPTHLDFIRATETGSQTYDMRLINSLSGWLQLYGSKTSGGSALLASFRGANKNSFVFTGGGPGSPSIITSTGDVNASIQISSNGLGDTDVGSPTSVTHVMGPLRFSSYRYANLPSLGHGGEQVFCSDCLKPGEQRGGGSGMMVFDDGHSRWISTAGTIAAH